MTCLSELLLWNSVFMRMPSKFIHMGSGMRWLQRIFNPYQFSCYLFCEIFSGISCWVFFWARNVKSIMGSQFKPRAFMLRSLFYCNYHLSFKGFAAPSLLLRWFIYRRELEEIFRLQTLKNMSWDVRFKTKLAYCIGAGNKRQAVLCLLLICPYTCTSCHLGLLYMVLYHFYFLT